jgi:hypothetical protein
MSAKKDTQKSGKSTTATGKKSGGFTDDERAAMRERARELKAEARADRDRADGERDVLAKIAEMPQPDRAMAKRLHAIISQRAGPRAEAWYDARMPERQSRASSATPRSSRRGL